MRAILWILVLQAWGFVDFLLVLAVYEIWQHLGSRGRCGTGSPPTGLEG